MLSFVGTLSTKTPELLRAATSHVIWIMALWSIDTVLPRLKAHSPPLLSVQTLTALFDVSAANVTKPAHTTNNGCSTTVHTADCSAPYRIASNSKPMICPSARSRNISRIAAGTVQSVYVIHPLSTSTAAIRGGLLAASQNKSAADDL